MLCLSAMPLEQRSLILKIPASHRTRTPNTQEPFCTGRPNSLMAITAKLLLFSRSLHNFQSTCDSSVRVRLHQVSRRREMGVTPCRYLKPEPFQVGPESFAYSTVPNIYQKSLPDTCDQVMRKQLVETKHRHFTCNCGHPNPSVTQD